MLELKLSLMNAIDQWINDQAESNTDGWQELDCPMGDMTTELMADSAMNILLAQQTQNLYLYQNDMMKEA